MARSDQMAHLHATLRNNYLRISILESHPDAVLLNEMQTEFVQLLQSARTSEVVVVNLPEVHQVESGLITMLLTWRRIALLAGRKFRMNGVSGIVNQILEQISEPNQHRCINPHRKPSRTPAFA